MALVDVEVHLRERGWEGGANLKHPNTYYIL